MLRRWMLIALLLGTVPAHYGCAALAGGVIGGAIGAEAAEDDDE